MKASQRNMNMKRGALAALLLAAALLIFSLTVMLTDARYVTEVNGDDNFNYETQAPCFVSSQQELFNAIKSGYGYVKLSDELKAPIIMTGDSLDLKRDLTIDLNGNEIERNNRNSLLNVPDGRSFTVIDTRGGGGLYNPIGSVLTVAGGDLNVYGGMFESGPRPTEYYSNLVAAGGYKIDIGNVTKVETDGSSSPADNIIMPRLPMRTSGAATDSANVYFDVDIVYGDKTLIKRDTYCFVVFSGATNDSFDTYDVRQSSFAYTYYIDAYGNPTDDISADGVRQAMLFGYENDIAYSVERTDGATTIAAPNYAAVNMTSGKLNVNVIGTNADKVSRSRSEGSFYSYFGTWQTSCIYMTGGTMTISTSGELKTVDPQELPAVDTSVDTASNSAKYSEGACILCDGGTLDFKKVHSATSYNGSVVSVSGGNVTMDSVNITKNATVSHANSPFEIADIQNDEGASEFPRARQYRDAAIFVNGGSLDMSSSKIVVNKDLNEELSQVAGQRAFKTTFGILSRGRSDSATISKLSGSGTTIEMHGDHSYGVFGTRGKIELTDGWITLDSDSYCYGVYAINKTAVSERAVDIELKNTDITLGNATESGTYVASKPASDWVNSKGEKVSADDADAKRALSIGVYLDSSEFGGGMVTMDSSEINSQEMGVAVNEGNLIFKNGGAISAYNASAIYLNGGNIYFQNAYDGKIEHYDVTCRINRMGNGSATCSATDEEALAAGTHRYATFVPWQWETDGGNISVGEYANEHGVLVEGGSLDAQGKLHVDFTGLYNRFDQYQSTGINYDKILIKSFAIACVQSSDAKDENNSANISVKYADISTSVGGGVKVQGGSVVLGDENTAADDIVVNTKGSVHGKTPFNVSDRHTADTWKFYANLSGGHAVIARGGSMIVYNGKYTASYCNGIAATNDSSQATKIDIYDGVFTGNLTHSAGNVPQYATGSGPASHYGLKVMGGSSVNIYGGTFDGKNGGAFIRGSSSTDLALVNIYSGSFGKEIETLQTDGQDGFNVYDYSTVNFGAYTDAQLTESGFADSASRQNAIKVYANLFPIAVNPLLAGTADSPSQAHVTVRVYYGRYFIRNSTRNDLGMGAIDDTMDYVNFNIYGVGVNVYDQPRGGWTNDVRVRGGNANAHGSKTLSRTPQYFAQA